MNTLRIIGLLVLAGFAEISGAYLIWQWIRSNKSAWMGLLGVVALLVYGLIQTLQPFNFGRVFAAYGGVFITVALLWGWLVDGQVPDRWDLIGASFAIGGAAIILWGPRP